jgi:hypothetical protein
VLDWPWLHARCNSDTLRSIQLALAGARLVMASSLSPAGDRARAAGRAPATCVLRAVDIYMGRRWAMAIVRPRRRRGLEEEEEQPHYYSTLINCQNWHPWRGDIDGDHARRAATYAMEALLCPVRAGSSSMQCAYTSKERGSIPVSVGEITAFQIIPDWLIDDEKYVTC